MSRAWWRVVVASLGWLVAVGGWSVPALAENPTAAMELLVVIPHGHHLAVYEQVVLSRAARPPLAVLSGHGALMPINFKAVTDRGNLVAPVTAGRVFALKYSVPWDGVSGLQHMTLSLATNALVVMIPENTLTLPAVLNPTWQNLAPRRIPDLPDSPLFNVWATGNARAGQTVAFALEAAGAGGVVPATAPEPAGYPAAGALLKVLLVLVLLAALLLVVNWRPLGPLAEHRRRDELLAALAQLEAHFRHGGLEEPVYRAQRDDMLAELTRRGG
jgi:hypothetical protein